MDPSEPMSADQMAMMAALLRRQTGPLAWNQEQPSDGSNGGQQRSNVGMSNMMNPMAQALMKMKGAPTGGPTTAASITDMGAPATGNLYGLSGIGSGVGAPAASGSGLLPGSVAGADMADTAAYTPSAIEATTPGAGSSLGASLGGVGAAVGLGVLGKHLQDNTAGIGYNYSRQLADYLHQNSTAVDPTHGRGPNANTPLSPPPPGFKSWSEYFAATQVVQQSMGAEGGAKDQGTYKALLGEQGLPTDPSFYTKAYPGQDVAYRAIIGPNGMGTSSNGRGGR